MGDGWNFGLFELFVLGLMGVLLVMFVVVTVIAVTRIRSSHRALKEQGIDPAVAQARLLGRMAGTPATLEQRLAELDDMHRRGTITAEERASARARLLGGG